MKNLKTFDQFVNEGGGYFSGPYGLIHNMVKDFIEKEMNKAKIDFKLIPYSGPSGRPSKMITVAVKAKSDKEAEKIIKPIYDKAVDEIKRIEKEKRKK